MILKPGQPMKWTAELDAQLISLWGWNSMDKITVIMGLTRHRVWARGDKLGLTKRNFRAILTQPSKQEWIAAATKRATEARLRPCAIMAGVRGTAATQARWKAWKDVMDAKPSVTLAGLGRVTGFDHTSIRYGLARLAGCTRHQIVGGAT